MEEHSIPHSPAHFEKRYRELFWNPGTIAQRRRGFGVTFRPILQRLAALRRLSEVPHAQY